MDSFCLILVGCHTLIVATVVIAVEARQRRKLAEMERIALDLAKENAALKKELKNEVPLSQVQAAAQGQGKSDGPPCAVPDLRPENAAAGGDSWGD